MRKIMAMSNTILLIEDNADDAAMTITSLRDANVQNEIVHCRTGDEALALLYNRNGKEEKSASMYLPALILLDLNLPGTDGREVLRTLKEDELRKIIPVIVLTTSSDESDINGCYDAGANSYIVKPVGFEGFITAMEQLSDYWLEIAVTPRVGLN